MIEAKDYFSAVAEDWDEMHTGGRLVLTDLDIHDQETQALAGERRAAGGRVRADHLSADAHR